MNEEMNVIEVINEEGVNTVCEEAISASTLNIKKIALGLGLVGAIAGLGYLGYKAVKKYRDKKNTIVDAEVCEDEE